MTWVQKINPYHTRNATRRASADRQEDTKMLRNKDTPPAWLPIATFPVPGFYGGSLSFTQPLDSLEWIIVLYVGRRSETLRRRWAWICVEKMEDGECWEVDCATDNEHLPRLTLMFELRTRDGRRSALPYSYMTRADFDPEKWIEIYVSSVMILVKGWDLILVTKEYL